MRNHAFVRPLLLVSSLISLLVTGCERKERVLEIQTPGAEVKVDRNLDTGGVEVQTDRK